MLDNRVTVKIRVLVVPEFNQRLKSLFVLASTQFQSLVNIKFGCKCIFVVLIVPAFHYSCTCCCTLPLLFPIFSAHDPQACCVRPKVSDNTNNYYYCATSNSNKWLPYISSLGLNHEPVLEVSADKRSWCCYLLSKYFRSSFSYSQGSFVTDRMSCMYVTTATVTHIILLCNIAQQIQQIVVVGGDAENSAAISVFV